VIAFQSGAVPSQNREQSEGGACEHREIWQAVACEVHRGAGGAEQMRRKDDAGREAAFRGAEGSSGS